ncbi:hypothetical protein [Caballeronia sp. NK8]
MIVHEEMAALRGHFAFCGASLHEAQRAASLPADSIGVTDLI